MKTDTLHHPTPFGVVEPVVAGLAEVGLLHVHHLVDEDRGDQQRVSTPELVGVDRDLVDATTLGLAEALIRVEAAETLFPLQCDQSLGKPVLEQLGVEMVEQRVQLAVKGKPFLTLAARCRRTGPPPI